MAARRQGGIWKRWLLVLATALVLLVLTLELASRIADEREPGSSALLDKLALRTLDPAARKLEDARAVPHPYLGYALKPAWSTPAGAPQQCSHNALGFRGKETTWEKPPGVFRILTLGGSSVYGSSESRDEAVWSQRLEEMLNARGGSTRVEVVNGGCLGWTSFEQLIQLELRGLDLEPDLVILYAAVNDMRAALYTGAQPLPERDNTHWRATWPVDRPSALERWLEGSRAYLVWRRYCTDYVLTRQDLFYWTIAGYDPARNDLYCLEGRDYPPGEVPGQGFASYRRNLEHMIALTQRRGARFLVATQALMRWDMPQRECAQTQVESFERILAIQREVASREGALLAETGAAIEAADERHFQEKGQRLFKNDVHPFDAGSEVIARAVADAVLSLGLLPP